MKLSELIREYRKRTNISQREFSRKCDLSNTYISFLENEKNPKTGRPLVPTLEQYRKLADGMDITVQRLFELLDEDAPVDLHTIVQNHAEQSHVFIPDSEGFRILVKYMPQDDYLMVMQAFEKAYKKAKEAGEDIK